VIGDDHPWLATPPNQVRQLASNPPSRDRGIGDGGQAFPRNVIDDVENAEASTAGELVVDKVQRPARIGPCLNKDRRSCSYGSSSRPPLAHAETFLSIEPIDAVDPRGLTALAQENEQAPIAKPLALVG
jgi:hypothetical protein